MSDGPSPAPSEDRGRLSSLSSDNPLNSSPPPPSSTNRMSIRPKLDENSTSMLSEMELTKIPPLAPADRKCTDLLFLFTFTLYWIGMCTIGFLGFRNGDPNRLIYGSNHEGVVCGGDLKPFSPYIVYPRVSKDVSYAGPVAFTKPWEVNFFGICASRCPREGEYVCTDDAETAIARIQDATPDDPPTRDSLIQSCLTTTNSILDDFVDLPNSSCEDSTIKSGCFDTLFNTTSVLFRCFPQYRYDVETLPESECTKFETILLANGDTQQQCVRYKSVKKVTREEPTSTDVLFDSFNTAANIVNRYVADVIMVYPVILVCGVGVSVVVGLLYVVSLWCCVGIMVWLSVILCICVSILFTVYCYFKAGIISSSQVDFLQASIGQLAATTEDLFSGDGSQVQTNSTSSEFLPFYFAPLSESYQFEFEVAAYTLTAISLILVILAISMGPRINKAIEIFAEASHCVRSNPALIVVPPCSMIMLVCVISFWAFTSAYIASSGELYIAELNTSFPVDPDEEVFEVQVFGAFSYSTLFMIYQFFGLLWSAQFLNGIGVMTTAGAVGSWYFAGSPEDRVYGHWPVLRSFYTTIRFHLGTLAFGSLLVSLVQFLRYIAAYIQARSKNLQKDNRIVKIIFCCVHCFLKCVETCVKFVSRNSYIMCALYGDSFCTSTKNAFFAIASNLRQVATVTFLGDIIMRFGQVMIASMAGLLCWVYLDNSKIYQFGGEKELSSILWPVGLSIILAWYIGAEVLSIYDITVDTILLSYCQDKKLAKYRSNYKEHTSTRFSAFVKRHRQRNSKRASQAVNDAEMRDAMKSGRYNRTTSLQEMAL